MRIPRRLINIAGTLLVLVALIAGTVLMALPVYFESFELAAEKRKVEASNGQLQSQIDALRTKEAEMPAVDADLESLHRQLPPIPQLDDVTQLVIKSAGRADVTITNVSFSPWVPFEPRGGQVVIEELPNTATGVSAEQAGASGEAAKPPSGEAGNPSEAEAGPPTTVAPPADAPELQIPVTITVTAPDLAAATRFMDELRSGPRLFQPDSIAFAEDQDLEFSLTVTGLVFVRRVT